MKENFLLDNWTASGNSMDEFKDVIKEVASKTDFSRINSRELTVLSFWRMEDGNMVFYRLEPDKTPSANGGVIPNRVSRIYPSKILAMGDFEALLKEVTDNVGILLYNGCKAMFVSHKVLTTRLQPFGLNGEFLAEKSYERDLLIARQFGNKALFRTLVTREQNGITKVFSILGERYKHLPQDILIKIYDELTNGGIMGRTECRHWEITHFLTGIQIEFPDKADEFQALYGLPEKVIPGIILETSDTGDCSIKVKGTWRIKNSISLISEVSKKHVGSLNIEDLLTETNANIFSEYTKLPEALCELMSTDITDPSWELRTASGKSKNNKKIESVLKQAFKQLKIVEAVGKTTEMSLFQQLNMEFDESISYTAYDIAISIMSMPERVTGLHSLTQEKLAKAVSKAPYIKYEGTSAPTPVILTA